MDRIEQQARVQGCKGASFPRLQLKLGRYCLWSMEYLPMAGSSPLPAGASRYFHRRVHVFR